MRRLYWRFRLRPNPTGKEYYTCFVFRTVEHLQAFLRGVNRRQGFSETFGQASAGCVRTWKRLIVSRRGRTRLHPEVGLILLCRERLGAGYVAHELGHAAIGWARRVRLRPAHVFGSGVGTHRYETRSNERFCEAMEHLHRQFWNKWYGRYRR